MSGVSAHPSPTALAGPSSEFGRGGAEPYDLSLRAGGGVLTLHSDDRGAGSSATLDVGSYLGPATESERRVLDQTDGPLLDVGCGPARIVRAAIEAGRLALGVDISRAAVEHARSRGLPVLRRSVFDQLPAEGTWGAVALFDGNIGIGGDPRSLLARCSSVLRSGGTMIVETHTDATRESRFSAQLVHSTGARSDWFPWAEAGERAVTSIVVDLGMNATSLTVGGRAFVLASRR